MPTPLPLSIRSVYNVPWARNVLLGSRSSFLSILCCIFPKRLPIAFLFSSGSCMPSTALMNSSSALYIIRSFIPARFRLFSTSSVSCFLIRPSIYRAYVFPMPSVLASTAATTVESTPPLTKQITSFSPTVSFMYSLHSSI